MKVAYNATGDIFARLHVWSCAEGVEPKYPKTDKRRAAVLGDPLRTDAPTVPDRCARDPSKLFMKFDQNNLIVYRGRGTHSSCWALKQSHGKSQKKKHVVENEASGVYDAPI
jgi:hypothetical protein